MPEFNLNDRMMDRFIKQIKEQERVWNEYVTKARKGDDYLPAYERLLEIQNRQLLTH